MENELVIFLWNLAAVGGLMTLGWAISLALRNVTVVDSLWGLGFILIAWNSFILAGAGPGRSLLLCLLVTIWGLRLSVYLTWRNWGKGEDPRYGSWRKAAGSRFWIVSLGKVFWLQALFLWVIAWALQHGIVQSAPSALTWLDLLGTGIWAAGMIIEAVADAQLAAFKRRPENRGRVMDKGLWAWSRHPNYFGEALVWWGVFIIVLSTPVSFWTVVSPILITLVLTKMTGVPLTEKTIAEKRPEYRRYIETVPAFFPRKPKRERQR